MRDWLMDLCPESSLPWYNRARAWGRTSTFTRRAPKGKGKRPEQLSQRARALNGEDALSRDEVREAEAGK